MVYGHISIITTSRDRVRNKDNTRVLSVFGLGFGLGLGLWLGFRTELSLRLELVLGLSPCHDYV